MKKESNKYKIKKIRFSLCITLVVFMLVLYINGLFAKLICLVKKCIYVEPSTISIILFFVLIAVYIVYTVDLCKITTKIKKHEHIKIGVITILTCIVFAFNLTCVNYIDTNGLHYDKVYYSDNEILNVEICVDKISHTLSSNAISYDYFIVCNLKTESTDIALVSQNFYSYEYLYKFLIRMEGKLTTIDKSGFSDLIDYEKRKLIPKSISDNNVDYIRRIEALCY